MKALNCVALAAVTALVCACASEAPRPARDTVVAASTNPIGWAFDVPANWDDRVTLDDNVPGTGTYRAARMFTYAPRDTSIVPQILLGIFVYDSAAWADVARQEGPPQGDSLTSSAGQVFIASLPQSNPFAEGSADYRTFDSLSVDLAAVKKGFRVAR
ncbi:MAG: hypothetical protein H7066_05340 [Cytophagaceae bacterium]|nr:hypothetical protein [Gemmatimonadaceae bacterium]